MNRALVAAALFAVCRKDTVAGSDPPPDPSSVGGGAISKDASRAGPRCHASAQGVTLDETPGVGGLEIGDAVVHGEGYAVAFLHRTSTPARLNVAVALVDADARGARVVDLGPTPEDSPPPRLASCGGAIVASSLGPPRVGGRGGRSDLDRSLLLYSVDPAGAEQLIAERHDESMAFDLACSGRVGVAVWDETVAGTPSRGVVRGAPFEVGGKVGAARDLSPPTSDAEMPRVISNGSAFLVFWLARRPEATESEGGSLQGSGSAARADLEATGEARSYGWLEMVAVDAAASVAGAPRHLTPTSGHISAYDVALRLTEPSHSALIVARDDGDSGDMPGGALLRVRAREDLVERPVRLPSDGLGRGPATFVESAPLAPGHEPPALWVSWVGPREDVRLLPLDADGETAGAPSVEDALDEARPLLWARGGLRMLVAAPADRAGQLRMFTCRP